MSIHRLEQLRGGLKRVGLGARGLEKLARNPSCRRAQAVTFAGSAPAQVVQAVYGEDPDDQQSPFALQAGNRFEARLLKSGAAALLAAYQETGLLAAGEDRVMVVPEAHPGRDEATRARRRALTERLIRARLAGASDTPHLIVHPRLEVHLAGVPHEIEPDALVASGSDRFYRPVEIKSYPDRRGKTDPADLKAARRQVAVAVIALRQLVSRLGTADPTQIALSRGDLVLRVPGSMRAALSSMALRGEVFSLEQMVREAPAALIEILAAVPEGGTLDDRGVLEGIPNAWRDGCREHCDLAGICRRLAGDGCAPAVLGDGARESLAAAGSTDRALALLHGRGAAPSSPAERALRDRLHSALEELQTAVGHVL